MPGSHALRLNGALRVGFRIRLARTWRERAIGLLGSRSLPADRGLWIAPCNSVHMVGMLYPIDVAYLDDSGRVLKLVRDLRPWRISACRRAKAALELRIGALDALGLREGDIVTLDRLPCSE